MRIQADTVLIKSIIVKKITLVHQKNTKHLCIFCVGLCYSVGKFYEWIHSPSYKKKKIKLL